MTPLTGACHCGRVRFRVEVEAFEALDCNCSICTKKGFLHLIVPKARFTLLSGEDALATYTFGTHVAKHHFCRACGVHAFYVPRSHPDGVDVNVRCLDDDAARARFVVTPFDGRNWEANVASIRR
ncbi:MAG: GFA family protein [Myxococcota bacterium]